MRDPVTAAEPEGSGAGGGRDPPPLPPPISEPIMPRPALPMAATADIFRPVAKAAPVFTAEEVAAINGPGPARA